MSIKSTRPVHASRLFLHKTPEYTLSTLPRLYTVCGIAQSFAALTACTEALGRPVDTAATLARQMLLVVETVREHCWWLLIDTDKSSLAPFLRQAAEFKKALFVGGDAFSLNSELQVDFIQLEALIFGLENNLDSVFGGQRLAFLALHTEECLLDWLKTNASVAALKLEHVLHQGHHGLGSTDFCLLPSLAAQYLDVCLSAENAAKFSRYPTWQGTPHESTCLNRVACEPLIASLLQNHGNGLLTRLASRLLELAALPLKLRQNLQALQQNTSSLLPPLGFEEGLILPTNSENTVLPPFSKGGCAGSAFTHNADIETLEGNGLSQIQASRGLLIHKVALKNGIIADYQIIAPTEWNFHPQGIAAKSLQQLNAKSKTKLHEQAALVINAIDPCVGFELLID